MKKTLILLLIFVLLLCGCGEKETETTAAPTAAPEVVETAAPVTEVPTIPADQEAVTEPAEEEVVIVYLPTRMSNLDETGAERWHREYAYDAQGRLTGEWEFSGDGELIYYAAVTYTDSGREWLYTYPEGRTMTIRETWDEQGNLLLWECIEDGAVEYYTEYTYNEQGWLLGYTTVYVHEGSPMSCTYEYDDRGNQIRVSEYTGDELMGTTEREFDEENRVTRAVYVDALSDWTFTNEYTWDGNTETAVQLNGDGQQGMTTITSYDDDGNVLRQETIQVDETVSCVEYTYEPFDIPVQ